MDTAPPTKSEEVRHISPEQLRTWIVEEDDDFIVLNKPGDIVCHPSKDGPWSSVVGAVKAWRGMEITHLVSRLDRETSGVLLIAKNKEIAGIAQTAIEKRMVSKVYLALLEGELKAPVLVDEPIERDATSPVLVKHRVARTDAARSAVTFFEPLHVREGRTLARVVPHTGRTHQIRVHAQWLGHSVVADKLYGPDELLYLEFVEQGWGPRHDALLELPRHALHAARLEFKTQRLQRVFSAPMPADMRALVAQRFGPLDIDSLV